MSRVEYVTEEEFLAIKLDEPVSLMLPLKEGLGLYSIFILLHCSTYCMITLAGRHGSNLFACTTLPSIEHTNCLICDAFQTARDVVLLGAL